MTKDDLIRELHQKLDNKHTMKDLTVIVYAGTQMPVLV